MRSDLGDGQTHALLGACQRAAVLLHGALGEQNVERVRSVAIDVSLLERRVRQFQSIARCHRTLSLALYVAAGIVLAVVGIDLIPEALEIERSWIPVLALVAGGIGFMLLERAIGWVQGRFAGVKAGASSDRGAQQEDEEASSGLWAIYAAVAIDLFSDGVMIGTGSNIALSLGLLLVLGQAPADIPEGFATIATFKDQGIPRARRLLLAASFAVPILLGAALGFFGVRSWPEIVKLSMLAFTAGILLSVAVEEMIPEAHEAGEPRFAPLALVSGFAIFALISAYVG